MKHEKLWIVAFVAIALALMTAPAWCVTYRGDAPLTFTVYPYSQHLSDCAIDSVMVGDGSFMELQVQYRQGTAWLDWRSFSMADCRAIGVGLVNETTYLLYLPLPSGVWALRFRALDDAGNPGCWIESPEEVTVRRYGKPITVRWGD